MCVAARRFWVLIFLASEREQLLDLVESGLIWDANSSSSSLRSSSGENTVGAVHKHTKHFWCCRCRGVSLLLEARSRRTPDGCLPSVFVVERKMFLIEKDNRVLLWRARWGYGSPACVCTHTKTNEFQQQTWGTFFSLI